MREILAISQGQGPSPCYYGGITQSLPCNVLFFSDSILKYLHGCCSGPVSIAEGKNLFWRSGCTVGEVLDLAGGRLVELVAGASTVVIHSGTNNLIQVS